MSNVNKVNRRSYFYFSRPSINKILIFIIGWVVFFAIFMTFKLPSPNKTLEENSLNLLNTDIAQRKQTTLKIPRTDFVSELVKVAIAQFNHYSHYCKNSDVFRPLTQTCRNYSSNSETHLSYLAFNQLLKIGRLDNITNFQITFKDKKGVEIGRVADYVIAPLISAYYITNEMNFLETAISLTNDLLSFLKSGPIPPPYINTGTDQHFGRNEVYIDDVSAVFPIIASIAYLTKKAVYTNAVKLFVNQIRESTSTNNNIVPIKYSLNSYKGISTSIHDFPFRLFADLNRISKILPEIETTNITNIGLNSFNKGNPTTVFDVDYVKAQSIEPCWFASIMPQTDKMYSLLLNKCIKIKKMKTFPSRMNGVSEFGPYDLLTQFEFDGELLELFWKNNLIDDAKTMIMNTIEECSVDGFITGMRNTTKEGKRSDNTLHPQFFSRWALNGVLIDAGIKYDDVVISDCGHILKM